MTLHTTHPATTKHQPHKVNVSIYRPNFEQNVKVGFWDKQKQLHQQQQQQIKTNNKISAITDPIWSNFRICIWINNNNNNEKQLKQQQDNNNKTTKQQKQQQQQQPQLSWVVTQWNLI